MKKAVNRQRAARIDPTSNSSFLPSDRKPAPSDNKSGAPSLTGLISI
ncbi:hypothetical protein [Marivirga sp.]|nr:hypothetical protein [Marivirga sp.]